MKTKMPELNYVGSPRLICDVLEEMRGAVKHLHIALIPGLIEEAQTLANRMENALGLEDTIEKVEQDICKLKDAKRALRREVKALIKQRDKG